VRWRTEAMQLCTLPRRPLGWAGLDSAGSPIKLIGYQEIVVMLETIAVVLLVLWAVGLVSSYTMGGFIHILLVSALVIIVVRVIQGRRI